MKAQGRGDVHALVYMMKPVEVPKKGRYMIQSVPPVHKKIEAEDLSNQAYVKGNCDQVEKTDMAVIQPADGLLKKITCQESYAGIENTNGDISCIVHTGSGLLLLRNNMLC